MKFQNKNIATYLFVNVSQLHQRVPFREELDPRKNDPSPDMDRYREHVCSLDRMIPIVSISGYTALGS